MANKKIELKLTIFQIEDLERIRDNHPLAYIRERSGAILKISQGQSGYSVALKGLLRQRDPDSVYEWVKRYKEQGKDGLFIKSGRGRKASYSSEQLDCDGAKEQILNIIGREPRQFDHNQSRWTLDCIKKTCNFLQELTVQAVWWTLKNLKIHYKRGRNHVHSPDNNYLSKLKDIRLSLKYVKKHFDSSVLLFQDEFSYYRQPTLANDYEKAGHFQPLARYSHKSNACYRVVATLNAFTGQVTYKQSSKIGIVNLVDFYEQVCQEYQGIGTIYIVQDNWPIHFHPDVLACMQPQTFKYPLHLPWNWPEQPTSKARYLNLPIKLLSLPTYASWNNPIEKLWRWLKQEVLHLHRYADRWAELKDLVSQFLHQFVKGSWELLHYVGLSDISKLYKHAFFNTT